ncbi:type IV pilus twitching motility protein PilT [Fusobacterium gastrosuis]|uniref:type IV pilus twitching motility protein PilT n=2 Tax=Fusobacterium TaxID=848 RepID=UPI0029701828|nr:ATPase, T2SS/T4P/T4SS family [Fusobacteriaceae bacterium]MDY5712555.1 ATPase, T2SS/T4P/T4SS family [Fusobacterium gastrosuis]
MLIHEILDYARENKISDIHILENEKVYFRKFGEIFKDNIFSKINRSQLESICLNKIDEDFIFMDKQNRYRISSFLTMGKLGLSIRVIDNELILLKERFINELIHKKILTLKDGLILVTGATGSGKSTTLANFIECFNQEKNYKILTLEDPIEYVFKNRKSYIIQREIGKDVKNYEIALKNALRQDPDIVVVGEIRDIESLDAVLKLAETGHLVLTTLHTNSAVESVNRIVSMVLAEKKDFIRQQLASVLRFIFSQELYIDREKQERKAIFEILNNTKAVSNLILNNKINQIPNLIASGIDNYMTTKERYFSMIEKKI